MITQLLAQTTTTAPAEGKPLPDWMAAVRSFFPIVLMVVVLFFLMNRSKKSQDKQRTEMLANLKKGDEIQTIGGILGKVMEAREDRVLVKVDENSNTKMWFSRNAIHKVIGAEAESK